MKKTKGNPMTPELLELDKTIQQELKARDDVRDDLLSFLPTAVSEHQARMYTARRTLKGRKSSAPPAPKPEVEEDDSEAA